MDKEKVINSLPIRDFYDNELPGIKWNGKDGKVRCCFHEDKEPSLSINNATGFYKCFGCDASGDVFSFYMQKHGVDFPQALKAMGEFAGVSTTRKRGGVGSVRSSEKSATTQHEAQHTENTKEKPQNDVQQLRNVAATPTGITLKQYAEAKKLDIDFLKRLGLSDITYLDAPAIRIPYYNTDGNEVSVRIRTELNKSDGQDNRFKWKKGSKPFLHGLQHKYREKYCILVEGESDCHTLWANGFPAYGVPGATNWKDDRDAQHFDGVETIYAVIEGDAGGKSLKETLSRSRIKDRIKILSFDNFKDPSALYLDNPDTFKARMQEAIDKAVPWGDIEREENEQRREELWGRCQFLATQQNILKLFTKDLHQLGVHGEDTVAETVFLSLVSRYLDRPVSNIVKGQSSGGKSFVVQETLKFFPKAAYFSLTDMSAKLLAFTDEPLNHRFIILYEASGLTSGKGKDGEGDDQTKNYFIRSLLSEGCIDYGITVKTKDGFEGRRIHKDGPSGLILTTTKVALHPENETRYLSFTINDTPEQTKNVLRAIARKQDDDATTNVDFDCWHALHEWLDLGVHDVYIPYAMNLAEAIPPVAVRLRRDFTLLLNLIKAHSILHQANRERDIQGRILATLDDYAVIRNLVSNVISDSVGATVDKKVREVVIAVEKAIVGDNDHATLQHLCNTLKLHKSTVSRRVSQAISSGYLVNTQDKRGKPYKLIIGEPLPGEVELLPAPEKVGCCTVADIPKEYSTTPPSPSEDDFIHEEDDDEEKVQLPTDTRVHGWMPKGGKI